MTVCATGDFKTILRHAKLARLMHEIARRDDGTYVIALDGPASALVQTRRYGVAFARFLPALLTCRGWKAEATLRSPRGWRSRLAVSSADGLGSRLPPPQDYDSSVEEGFARKFGDAPRDGWTLLREAEIVHRRQATFVPDFVFAHEDGTRVLFEIVGFWTPQYLERKRATLAKLGRQRTLLAVPRQSLRRAVAPDDDVVVYGTGIKIAPVLEALERMRRRCGATSA
jgi:predicted nuclease of restriction endonuclease-like RecB superfamily